MKDIVRCADCGAEIPKVDAWRVRTLKGEDIVCDTCVIKRDPPNAKTYYYDYPYCEKCHKKLRTLGAKLCKACATEKIRA